jgi:hypothetical protein
MSRTDAAMGLILGILLEKSVISRSEMGDALSRAISSVGSCRHSELVSSVFTHLQAITEGPQDTARH